MKPIIVFDLGKVLVDFDYSIAARKIAAHSSKPPENLHTFPGDSPWLIELESGRISPPEFFDALRRFTGFRGTLADFNQSFADIFSPIPEMIDLHAGLRRRGFLTYIFSNTNDLAIGHIRRNFPFFKNFDGYIFSHEVGAMKPDAKIYEALEKLSGKRGAEIIYLDDRTENVKAGKLRGWKTILHETPQASRASLEKFLGA